MPKLTDNDPLQQEYFNRESIQDLADAFNLPYDEAVILWCRFVGTVDKLREVTLRLRSSSREEKSEGKGAGQP
jgi:hypothetical protein